MALKPLLEIISCEIQILTSSWIWVFLLRSIDSIRIWHTPIFFLHVPIEEPSSDLPDGSCHPFLLHRHNSDMVLKFISVNFSLKGCYLHFWTFKTNFKYYTISSINFISYFRRNLTLYFVGFGDALNCEDSWQACCSYIDDQFHQYFADESGLNRKNIIDNRVHCCLYFIPPYGHGYVYYLEIALISLYKQGIIVNHIVDHKSRFI